MATEWDEIVSGQGVELSLMKGGNVVQFRTTVQERTGSALILPMPEAEEAEHVLVKDGVIDVTISLKEGTLKFTTLIADRRISAQPVLILMRPHEIKKIGSRSYYRLSVVRPVRLRLMRDVVTPISEFKKATTLDVSGGGIMIQGKLEIKRDQLVEIELDLGAETLNAICKASFTKVEDRDGTDVFLTGLEFYTIEERERDKIVKFIFDHQRALKKKGIMR